MVDDKTKDKFNSVVDKAIINKIKSVAKDGIIDDMSANTLSNLFSIKYYIKSFETQQVQVDLAEQMGDALKKVDMSKFDFNKVKDMLKNIM